MAGSDSGGGLNNKINQAKQGVSAAKKAASGNWIGAAKDAVKSGAFKKALIMALVKFTAVLLIIVAVAGAVFGLINAIKDAFIDIIATVASRVKGFFAKIWRWLTDDYWTKLDEKVEFYVDMDTFETLRSR